MKLPLSTRTGLVVYLSIILLVRDGRVIYEQEQLKILLGGLGMNDLQEQDRITNDVYFSLIKLGIIAFRSIVKLPSGIAFGEKGIDDNQRRNATVICETDCQTAYMLKEDYTLVLREISMAKAAKKKSFVYEKIFKKSIPQGIADRLYYDLFRLKINKERGEYVFHQNQLAEYLYIVAKGKVLLYIDKDLESKPFKHTLFNPRVVKKRFALAEISQGQMFGEEHLLLKSKKYVFGALCLADCTILRITFPTLNTHMDFEPLLKYVIRYTSNQMFKQRLSELWKQMHLKQSMIEDHNLHFLPLEDQDTPEEKEKHRLFKDKSLISQDLMVQYSSPKALELEGLNIAPRSLSKQKSILKKIIPPRARSKEKYDFEKKAIGSPREYEDMFQGEDLDRTLTEVCYKSRVQYINERKRRIESIKYLYKPGKKLTSKSLEIVRMVDSNKELHKETTETRHSTLAESMIGVKRNTVNSANFFFPYSLCNFQGKDIGTIQ